MKRPCIILISLLCAAISWSQSMVNYYYAKSDPLQYGEILYVFDIELPNSTQTNWQNIRDDLFREAKKKGCVDSSIMTRRTKYTDDYHTNYEPDLGVMLNYTSLRKHHIKSGVFTAILYNTVKGGFGSMPERHYYLNYDIKTGKRLNLDDIFYIGCYSDFTKVLTEYWQSCHKESKDYLFLSGEDEPYPYDEIMNGEYNIPQAKVFPVNNFILEEDGILFIYRAIDIYGNYHTDIGLKIKWEFAGKWLMTRSFILACD